MAVLTRRKFMRRMVLTLGATGMACCGLGYAASQTQPVSPVEAVETPNWIFGKEDHMSKRILVVYATRTGSTPGVAAKIGEVLAGRGYQVEVQPVSANPDPGNYQAVVVGSAVNGGKWLSPAIDYVRNHQQLLREMPVGLFCVHILNRGSDAGARKRRMAYLNEVRSLLQRDADEGSEGYFTGMGMDASNTSPFLMWIMRTTGFIPEGDCRDWEKIRTWAETIIA